MFGRALAGVRKSGFSPEYAGHPMDAEQINHIGATLSDLSVRTVDLRRYL